MTTGLYNLFTGTFAIVSYCSDRPGNYIRGATRLGYIAMQTAEKQVAEESDQYS
jgi:hypothetical protein